MKNWIISIVVTIAVFVALNFLFWAIANRTHDDGMPFGYIIMQLITITATAILQVVIMVLLLCNVRGVLPYLCLFTSIYSLVATAGYFYMIKLRQATDMLLDLFDEKNEKLNPFWGLHTLLLLPLILQILIFIILLIKRVPKKSNYEEGAQTTAA